MSWVDEIVGGLFGPRFGGERGDKSPSLNCKAVPMCKNCKHYHAGKTCDEFMQSCKNSSGFIGLK